MATFIRCPIQHVAASRALRSTLNILRLSRLFFKSYSARYYPYSSQSLVCWRRFKITTQYFDCIQQAQSICRLLPRTQFRGSFSIDDGIYRLIGLLAFKFNNLNNNSHGLLHKHDRSRMRSAVILSCFIKYTSWNYS